MWFVQLQRVALQLRARSAAQPLLAPPAPLQHHQPGAQLTLVIPTFLWRVKCITSLMPNHQEEHRGKASPQQIQPELKKESTDQGERGDDATKDWRKQRQHSTTHPKMRIRTEEEDLKTMQQRIKIGQGTTNNQRLKTFKTSICSTFLSVTLPRLSTLLTQIGLLLFSSNKIDQVTSNSYMISSLVNP